MRTAASKKYSQWFQTTPIPVRTSPNNILNPVSKYVPVLVLASGKAIPNFSSVPFKAWNLPPYKLALGAVYDFQDKLLVKLEAEFLGARKGGALVPDTIPFSEQPQVIAARDMDGYLDLHLGLEYRYTKRLSVFLDISNLSASKYERWNNYRVQRGLVLGGATFSF